MAGSQDGKFADNSRPLPFVYPKRKLVSTEVEEIRRRAFRPLFARVEPEGYFESEPICPR